MEDLGDAQLRVGGAHYFFLRRSLAPCAGWLAGAPSLGAHPLGAFAALDALLADTRGSLQKLDAVLVEAQGVAANTREATTDLTALRAEVEASLRRVDGLILDLNRRWPFARDAEVKLP